MKKQLHLLKSRIFGLLFLLWSAAFFAQTPLVNYQFTNNLTADAGALGSPTLTYHANGGAIKTPSYENNMLKTSDGGDYLELTINTIGKSGIVLSFNEAFQKSASSKTSKT